MVNRPYLILLGLAFGACIGSGFARFGYGLVLPSMRVDLGSIIDFGVAVVRESLSGCCDLSQIVAKLSTGYGRVNERAKEKE